MKCVESFYLDFFVDFYFYKHKCMNSDNQHKWSHNWSFVNKLVIVFKEGRTGTGCLRDQIFRYFVCFGLFSQVRFVRHGGTNLLDGFNGLSEPIFSEYNIKYGKVPLTSIFLIEVDFIGSLSLAIILGIYSWWTYVLIEKSAK